MNEDSTKACGLPSLYSDIQRLYVQIYTRFAKLNKQVSNHNLPKILLQRKIKNEERERQRNQKK